MSERPASNVSPFSGQDQDVAGVEERLERLLVTSVDADATWSLVRQRIGFDRDVAPIRPRRRPHRALVLAIAAALMLGGVALAAVAHQGRPGGQPATPTAHASQGVPGTAVRPETGRERPTPTPAPVASVTGTSPSATHPSPDTSSGSPSAEATQSPDQQQGQDQQGSGDQQSSNQPSGQNQQGPSDATDGSGVQSDTSASMDGDQGASPSGQATTDQQS